MNNAAIDKTVRHFHFSWVEIHRHGIARGAVYHGVVTDLSPKQSDQFTLTSDV